MTNTGRNDWALTEESFNRLLRLLDPHDRERAGRMYAELREGLEKLFAWRGAARPEELADETLNRVARKLDAGEPVRELHYYCLGVARLILLESFKKRAREEQLLGEFSRMQVETSDAAGEDSAVGECMARCLHRLTPENRDLVIRYYDGEGATLAADRRRLSERMGLPPGTLRMRVLRLRQELEECVARCIKSNKNL